MHPEIIEIKHGGVNCHLLKTGSGFILIDTGVSRKRSAIVRDMEKAGCRMGNLKLIFHTHADFDHTGNSVFLREKYNTKIAMHRLESEAVEKGSLLLNRKDRSHHVKMFSGTAYKLAMFFMGFSNFEKFKPDIYLEDGDDLSEYGVDAEVIHIPGHSRGSLGVLTSGGDFFCGDLLVNKRQPILNNLIDDLPTAKASIERLKSLKINTVYTGHGRPFSMQTFFNNYRNPKGRY